MATYATKADVDALKAELQTTYVDAITDTLINLRAQLALNQYCDALLAQNNVNASAASNYSSAVGSSVTKQELDEIQANVSLRWQEFIDLCLQGGVTVPDLNLSSFFWDLSKTSVS
jgi:hypothetical protein